MAESTPPSTFRKWQYTSTQGGLEKNLKLNSVSLPEPTPDQHVVKVIAAALNPVDYKPAEVPYVGRWLTGDVATPGIDFAGRIVIPAAGSPLKPGQLVFGGASEAICAAGALTEYAVVPKHTVGPVPDGLDPMNAATIPVAGLTAYQSIVPYVKKGDKIFINGGSGGTGIFELQIAKAVGCYIVTTCSTPNVELCKKLGADEVIDYRKSGVYDALKASGHKFDRIIDNVGLDPSLYYRCHEYTKPTAEYIMIAGLISWYFFYHTMRMRYCPSILGGGRRNCPAFSPHTDQADALRIANWMKAGVIKPIVDSRWAYEDAPKAFERLKTGRAKGKILVEVAPVSG